MKISARILPLHFFLIAMYVYLFIDITRRFVPEISFAVILVDCFLICSVFCLYLQMYIKRISVVSSVAFGPYILMTMIVFAVLITNITGLLPSIFIFLLSVKVYILPMLFVVFGMYLYQLIINRNDCTKIVLELKRYSYFIMSIGLLQFLLNFLGISFLAPLEHSIHSYGFEEINLISSGFVSSKKYIRILAFLAIFTILIATYHNIRIKWFHFFTLLSVLISGSREGAVVFILFTVIFIYKNPQYLNIRYRKALLIFSILPSVFLISYMSKSSILLSFIFSINDPLAFIKRIVMLMPIFLIDFTNELFYFGLGASRYGIETKLIPGLREVVDPLVHQVAPDYVSAAFGLVTFVDSGAFKLIIDFGYTGAVIAFTMISIVLFPFISSFFSRRSSTLMFGFSFLAFFWVILFLKAHSMISDVIMASLFYTLLGLSSAVRSHEKKNTNLL